MVYLPCKPRGRWKPHNLIIVNLFACHTCVLNLLVPSPDTEKPLWGFFLSSFLRLMRRGSLSRVLASGLLLYEHFCLFLLRFEDLLSWEVVLLLLFRWHRKSLSNLWATTEWRLSSSEALASANFCTFIVRGASCLMLPSGAIIITKNNSQVQEKCLRKMQDFLFNSIEL